MGSSSEIEGARSGKWGIRGSRVGIAMGLHAAAVLAVPLVVAHERAADSPSVAATGDAGEDGGDGGDAASDERAVRALAGVWYRWEAGDEGDPLRFYYFHGDRKGLYRYGKSGLNNTHSFDYDVVGDRLTLRFRKRGKAHDVVYRIERGDDGRDWLSLASDPEEGGATRYFRTHAGPISAVDGPPPSGHMWIDLERYATGGAGFHFYQLRPAGIDGRGVGWFHRGDFDDWSTESLVYRIVDGRIEMWFPVTGQHGTTAFSIDQDDAGRVMTLAADPRDFWHPHRYTDAGPSFGSLTDERDEGDALAWIASTARLGAP